MQVAFRLTYVLAACVLWSCASSGHLAGTPESPRSVWKAPPSAGAPFSPSEYRADTHGSALPADLTEKRQHLSLDDVVDLALINSPLTRASWSAARSAAAALGSARGNWFPTLEATATGGPTQSISQNPARIPANRSTVTTQLSLQYVLLDFGARNGAIAVAREGLFASDLLHNATVQSVVLLSETAYFSYQASRGLLDAARQGVATAQANLNAADQRHKVGLATIADFLQARTALSQATLEAQTAEANLQAARAQLALTLGLEANTTFDVAPDSGPRPIQQLAENVDSLIERATRGRPDVAAARAAARSVAAQVRIARSSMLPSLTIGAVSGRNFSNVNALEGRTYALTFGVSVPIFNGLSHEYDVTAASEAAAAAVARAEQTRLQAVAQVFTSYYALQTATQHVNTAAELLESAVRSEEVARGRYTEGVGTILDLLTAQSVLADARAQSVQSRWTWYATLAQLSHDVGVLGPHGEPNLSLTADSTRKR